MTVSTLSMWSCLLFNLKNGLFLSNLFTVLSLYHLYLPVIIMIMFLSFLRERDFRPDTSTWTLDPTFSAFSRIWLIHSFWYLQFIFPHGLESSSSHSYTLKSMNVYLLGEWMNQQIFFSPWVPSSFCPLWLSSYSHTWESCLHLLCQYTQFSFASQLLYFDLLLCCWISSCSYQLSAKYIFSVQIAWFYLIPSYIWYCWPQWLTC